MYYVNAFNTFDSDKRARTHDKPRTRARVFCPHAGRANHAECPLMFDYDF